MRGGEEEPRRTRSKKRASERSGAVGSGRRRGTAVVFSVRVVVVSCNPVPAALLEERRERRGRSRPPARLQNRIYAGVVLRVCVSEPCESLLLLAGPAGSYSLLPVPVRWGCHPPAACRPRLPAPTPTPLCRGRRNGQTAEAPTSFSTFSRDFATKPGGVAVWTVGRGGFVTSRLCRLGPVRFICDDARAFACSALWAPGVGNVAGDGLCVKKEE